ncbi:MAG TPA: hypothetical protein VGE18_03290 [Candidatus Paceibacterota bacterium]
MQDETITREEMEFDEVFAKIPDEVQDFMGSEAFELIMAAMKTVLELTDAQAESARIAAYEVLIGEKTIESIGETLIASGMAPELASKILYVIDEEITSRAKNIAEFYTGAENDEPVPIENGTVPSSVNAPSPSDVLANLGARLNQSSVIVPSKRDYSAHTQPIEKPAVQTITPSTDPYRELPEK